MPPISGGGVDLSFGLAGTPREARGTVFVSQVSAGYFHALGMRLRAGRDFPELETTDAPPTAVINEALAARYFGGGNPIGRRVDLGAQSGLEVIGVVSNAKYLSLRDSDPPTIYTSVLRMPVPGLTLVAMAKTDAAAGIARVNAPCAGWSIGSPILASAAPPSPPRHVDGRRPAAPGV